MKMYCPICDCEQEITPIQKKETYPVKGEPITIIATVCPCPVCGEEIMTMEYDDENLRQAYRIYRQRHNLLQPEEIKEIREKYEISQTTFARLLGVGDKTIARYENGSLQDEAINNLILLAKEPFNLMTLLRKNGSKISDSEAYRLDREYGKVKGYISWGCCDQSYTYYSLEGLEALA